MRFLNALVLLAVLFLGQAQPCRPIYLRADGTPCAACPEEEAARKLQASTEAVVSAGDCKSCCSIASMSMQRGIKSAPASGRAADCAPLQSAASLRVEWPEAAISAISVHLEASLPNAPPTESQGRSPPFRLS